MCNLRKQAVHVITILGGSLEQDNVIYTTEQCGDNAGVSPGGNTSRVWWRTPRPRPRGSRDRRGLSCYPPAPATPAHTRAQYHEHIDQSEWSITRQQPMRAHLGAGVLLDLPQPVWAAVEGGLVGDVVHEDQGVGGPVVRLQYGNVHIQKCLVETDFTFYIRFSYRENVSKHIVLADLSDAAEPLLARRVPDLQLDLLPVNLHGLDHEVHADGGALHGVAAVSNTISAAK